VALHHEIASCFLMQGPQQIQLLVEPLGSETNSGFGNLGQPFAAMPHSINGGAAAGNRPAAIQRFNPTHHARQILGDSQIATTQLLQGSYSMVSVVYRVELVAA
jgi:hypothetical protein